VPEQSKQWTDRKQRLTAHRLHELLCAKGITVGYSWSRRRIGSGGGSARMCSCRWCVGQAIWARWTTLEVVVEAAGKRQKPWMFVLRLMYSGRDFAWLYPRQDQVCFLFGWAVSTS